jgi:DNA-directed RNA polymerase subunit RPC12/RpoP
MSKDLLCLKCNQEFGLEDLSPEELDRYESDYSFKCPNCGEELTDEDFESD